MAEIKRLQGHILIDYMARDYESFLRSMREQIPLKLPEWKDHESEADFGNILLQLFAHMGDILSYYQDRVANESFLNTAQNRRSIINHLRLIGYQLSTAAPASAELRLTVPRSCEETITIKKGDAFATKGKKDTPSIRFEYNSDIDLYINCKTLPIDPEDAGKKYFEPILVEEGRLVKDEQIGISDGTPNQRYTMSHKGLILRSPGQGENRDIILTTQLGAKKPDYWTLRENLIFSTPGQRDFIIEIDEEDRAAVIFGDGIFGAIPTSGTVIKATYRVGGGALGNVPPDSIKIMVDAPDFVVEVTNPKPATGGAERESIGHAVLHAPKVFRSLKRAVTAEDYKALALNFKGIGKVRVEATNWNTVRLFVAPEGGGHVSDLLEADLLAYFEDKRPITTLIEIMDVDYVKIYVTARIGINPYYPSENLREKAKEAAGSLLSFENVDFAKTIYISKFYEAIEAIEGIDYVTITEFRKQGQAQGYYEPSGIITLNSNEIPRIPSDPEDGRDYIAGINVKIEGEA